MAKHPNSVSSKIGAMEIGDIVELPLKNMPALSSAMSRTRDALAPILPEWEVEKNRERAIARVTRIK